MSLDALYALVSPYLSQVEASIESTLRSGEDKAHAHLVDHVLATSGKRLRPVLTLLMFQLFCPHPTPTQEKQIVQIATAIELIHLASLVHDDVIDDADIRRGEPSVKGKWGNPVAVSFGVYVYAAAVQLVSESGQLQVLSAISSAVKAMCEGELYQLGERHNAALTVEKYMLMIRCKTAELFQAACLSGAYVAKASEADLVHIATYGHALGMLFQLTDDALDLLDDGAILKKSSAQDFKQGQFTLPLLYLLDALSDDEKAFFLAAPLNVDTEKWLKTRFSYYDIKHKVLSHCLDEEARAQRACSGFSDGPSKAALSVILDLVMVRFSTAI